MCGIYCLLFDTCPGVVTTSITAHQLIAGNLLPSLAHLLISICTSFLHISPLTSPSGMGKSCALLVQFYYKKLKAHPFPNPQCNQHQLPALPPPPTQPLLLLLLLCNFVHVVLVSFILALLSYSYLFAIAMVTMPSSSSSGKRLLYLLLPLHPLSC